MYTCDSTRLQESLLVAPQYLLDIVWKAALITLTGNSKNYQFHLPPFPYTQADGEGRTPCLLRSTGDLSLLILSHSGWDLKSDPGEVPVILTN